MVPLPSSLAIWMSPLWASMTSTGDGQAQPGPRSDRLRGEKGVEHPGEVFGGDPGTFVLDGDHVEPVFVSRRDVNRLARRAGLGRVDDDVADGLVQGAGGAEERRQGRELGSPR